MTVPRKKRFVFVSVFTLGVILIALFLRWVFLPPEKQIQNRLGLTQEVTIFCRTELPTGHILAGFCYDSRGMGYALLNGNRVTEAKHNLLERGGISDTYLAYVRDLTDNHVDFYHVFFSYNPTLARIVWSVDGKETEYNVGDPPSMVIIPSPFSDEYEHQPEIDYWLEDASGQRIGW